MRCDTESGAAVLTPQTRPLHGLGDVFLAGQPSPEALALGGTKACVR